MDNGSKAFKAGTGIDILMFERRVGPVSVLVELSKDKIPQFKESTAVTARTTGWFPTAFIGAKVDMDFRVRTAGTLRFARSYLPDEQYVHQGRLRHRARYDRLRHLWDKW